MLRDTDVTENDVAERGRVTVTTDPPLDYRVVSAEADHHGSPSKATH